MEHRIVYAEEGVYAGWPANHGAWQWGNEFLVGFLRGKYKHKSMHNIVEPFEKVLARSKDGGCSWAVEVPNLDFNCIGPAVSPPRLSFADGDIIRVCGVYDHGGDECLESGGFYLSHDRGLQWEGPFAFVGLEDRLGGDMICTARTRVLGDLVFLSAGQRDVWGTDYVFCATYKNGEFRFKSVVCEDEARAVMPAVARVRNRIVAVLRRRKSGRREGWIDAYGSDDEGANWRRLSYVGATGSHNGNPPALVALSDGQLVCCYGNRDYSAIFCSTSDDGGSSWHAPMLVRDEGDERKDIGYPQLFLDACGDPVCVYYWADAERPQQHIVATSIGDLL